MPENFPTTLVIAAIIAIVGLVFNYKGRNFSADQQAMLKQVIGIVLDAVGAVLVYIHALHSQVKQSVKVLYNKQGLKAPRMLVLVPLLLLCCQGCSSMTPMQNVAAVEAGFTTVVAGINAVEIIKPFPTATWALIQAGVTKANTALDVLNVEVNNGTITTNAQLVKAAAWVTVQAVLEELATYQQAGVVNVGNTSSPASSHPRLQLTRPNNLQSQNQQPYIFHRGVKGNYQIAA